MVERKLYKTKLCMLYQRGRCSRQNCNFAHGYPELRRSSNERQDYRGGRDLRERLGRLPSPLHESPLRGDHKPRHSSRGDSPRSHGEKFERNHRKRKQLDDPADYSGRISDGNEDQAKHRRQTTSDTKTRINEQLREMHSEIKILESEKQKLEMHLEDKIKVTDTLTLKIHELEMQLSKEKEERERFTAKIQKFIKAHNRHMRLQDELKRSHAQLQKLGEELDLDASEPDIEDDSRNNTINDDIIGVTNQLNEFQNIVSPQRKRSRVLPEVPDASNQDRVRSEIRINRVEKFSRQSGNHNQLSNITKPEADVDVHSDRWILPYEDKSRRGINHYTADNASADKYKVSETELPLPSTGIAAHAIDDVEVVDVDDKFQSAETDVTFNIPRLSFLPPPPPPIPRNVYLQYKGDEESVDIDGVDVEVDVI